jgi:glycosyl transferase family 87
MLPINFNPRKISDYIFHILLPILAVCLPVLFVSLGVSIMPRITTTAEQLFNVFSFCMWCVLFVVAYREVRAHPGISLEEGIMLLLPLFVSFFFLVLIIEYGAKSWDYEQYENAFRAIVQGENPYASERYLYPPFFAQVMAYVYLVGQKLLHPTRINLWLFVFYIYQCAQFFMSNLAYQLSSRFAARIGYSDLQTKLIVTGLFLFNFPMVRTLHLNQINLFVLNAILIALLALNMFPFLSGAAVTLGGLFKIYPFSMGVPLLMMKKWKVLLGAFVSGIIIILLQTNFGRDLFLWKEFVLFLLSFPSERESSLWIRNTTPLSMSVNLVRFTGLPESIIPPLVIIITLAALTWIALRFYRREKIYRSLPSGHAAEMYRNFGNLIDFSSLALLVTPSAWDHHFVIALPLALWAIALRRKDKPGWLGIAIASIFILPPVDIFPFSYLRMFGVVALLYLTSPNNFLEIPEISISSDLK